jgi:hypothetical protein
MFWMGRQVQRLRYEIMQENIGTLRDGFGRVGGTGGIVVASEIVGVSAYVVHIWVWN